MNARTEDEAKRRWCPFARVVTYDKNVNEFDVGVTVGMCASNKTSEGAIREGAHCIGSACMAWQWDAKQPVGEYDASYSEKHPDRRRGYCGLAGTP